jgi:hypothetical protein
MSGLTEHFIIEVRVFRSHVVSAGTAVIKPDFYVFAEDQQRKNVLFGHKNKVQLLKQTFIRQQKCLTTSIKNNLLLVILSGK